MPDKAEDKGCIAVDFDGTIAKYEGWQGPLFLGEPVPAMVDRVKQWLKDGEEVVIFTARINEDNPNLRLQIILAMQAWCQKHIGQVLEVTDRKHKRMRRFFDDRAVAVEKNTGKVLGGDEQAK